MTDPTTLLALAERCEQAAGPDRGLDAAIMCAFYGYTIHKDSNPAEGHFAFWEGEPEKSKCVNCSGWARVTEHLDAAVTLVPEGWGWAISTTGGGLPCAYGHPPGNGLAVRWIDDTPAATPALAMCAFALRARAAMG